MSSNWIEVLPAIGSFLGGPVGGLVGSGIEWLASRFGASDKTVEGIKQTLSGMTSEQLLEAKRIDIEFQKFCMENDIKLNLAQIAVNVEEAKSANWFVAGGRPAVIWIGALGLFYESFAEPLMRFIAQVLFKYTGTFPAIDTSITMQVLFGVLGIAGLRSYDKQKGTDTKSVGK